MNRRDFVQLMGLAGGAGLLNSCIPERQTEKIIPYLVPPDDGTIPGIASFKKTACVTCPAGCGINAKSVDYKVGKLEGIEGHPIGDGSLCMRGQTSLASLYHPERLKNPLQKNAAGGFDEISWDDAAKYVADALNSNRSNVFLSGRTTGTLSEVIDKFCHATGTERLPEFELFSHAAVREANRILFDRPEVPAYQIADADFLLTLGADIFETFTSPVFHAAQFGRAKKTADFDWYHVEPHTSLTGMQARRRFTLTPGSEPYLLTYLLNKVSHVNLAGDRHIAGMIATLPNLSDRGYAEKTGLPVEVLQEISRRLLDARRPLVVAGGVSTMHEQGLETALLAGLLQWATGMIGKTVNFSATENYDRVGTMKDIEKLTSRLDRGDVGVIFLSRIDAITTLSGNLEIHDRLAKAKVRVGIGSFMNDLMQSCDVVLPLSDNLESWGDLVPRHNLLAVIQPIIEPIHNTLSEGDILLQLTRRYKNDTASESYQQRLFRGWRQKYGDRNTEKLLAEGYLEIKGGDANVSLNRDGVDKHVGSIRLKEPLTKAALIMTPSIRFFDGRGRQTILLNEIPDPITTVSYGGWVSIAEEMGREKGVAEKGELSIELSGWSRALPVKYQQGMPRSIATVQYGSLDKIPVAIAAGSGELIAVFEGITTRPTGNTIALPILSGSQEQRGRNVIPGPKHEDEHHHEVAATLYPKKIHKHYRWAMAIDLDLCIGCGACAAACYVENNVPASGLEMHLTGREMSWLRIEPFYKEDETQFQPMLCQQCTNAPCETVCPVYATFHNEEGLNAQVYNRCVGTRYCSNNCPYKVRRFNWFDWDRPSPTNSTRNPEVSVRGRGIMEKCTFCVQRIRKARDHAKDNKRLIQDGEVVTACQQSCPTSAITFGNMLDENSEVHKKSKSDRVYRVFESLGTDPAIYYLSSKWKKKHAESHHETESAHG